MTLSQFFARRFGHATAQVQAPPPSEFERPDESQASSQQRQLELRAKLQELQKGDYHYMVDVVGACNLRCPSCAVGNYPQTEASGLMKFDTYQAILVKIAAEHPGEEVFVHLYNWGEPVLHRQLAKIVDLTKSMGFRCGISCNMNVFPDIAAVARSAPAYIRISLSGFFNSVYQRNHRRGDINLVKANMHLLRHFIDKVDSDTIVQVGFHVYRSNFPDDFFRMKELCNELDFIFAPTLAVISPVEKAIGAVDGIKLDSDSEMAQSDLVVSLKRRTEVLGAVRDRYPDCQFQKLFTTINFDGSVSLCCATYEKPQTIAEDFLKVSRQELQERKQGHRFCAECQSRNLDMIYTGVEPQLVDQEAVGVLGSKYDKFLQEWNTPLEIAVWWEGRRLTIQEACDLASEQQRLGIPSKAKELYEIVSDAAPKHAEAKFQLGALTESAGDIAAALGFYQRAAELYPGFQVYASARDRLLRTIEDGLER